MWGHSVLFGSHPRRRPPEFTAILIFEFFLRKRRLPLFQACSANPVAVTPERLYRKFPIVWDDWEDGDDHMETRFNHSNRKFRNLFIRNVLSSSFFTILGDQMTMSDLIIG